MQSIWPGQLIVDEHRRSLLQAGDTSRLVRASRTACPAGARAGVRALRSSVGWWLVHAGLRLAAGGRPAATHQPG